MVLLFMSFSIFAERFSVGVESPVGPHQISLAHSHPAPPRAERRGVRRLLGPEASVTTACVPRAEGAATNLRHGTEAGGAMRDHHADRAALFALHADAVRGRVRLAALQVGRAHV